MEALDEPRIEHEGVVESTADKARDEFIAEVRVRELRVRVRFRVRVRVRVRVRREMNSRYI